MKSEFYGLMVESNLPLLAGLITNTVKFGRIMDDTSTDISKALVLVNISSFLHKLMTIGVNIPLLILRFGWIYKIF